MNNLAEHDEIFIQNQFAALPRKSVLTSHKEAVWLRIQNQILAEPVPVLRFTLPLYTKALVSMVVVVAVVGIASKASEDSLPGETLYAVKKASEQVEKVLATSEEAEVKVGIKHARRRLEEVKILVEGKQKPEIVAKTLTALKNTTAAVVAASQEKPELADQALRLATEEHLVLTTVEDQVEEGEVKDAVQEILTLSRESINKLKGVEPEVEGTVTEEQATTTPKTISPTPKKKPQDGPIESEIQIHGVINLGEENSELDNQEPEIVPEPTVGF